MNKTILLLAIIPLMLVPAFAQESLTVETDKTVYNKNDTITISGMVADSQTQAFWLEVGDPTNTRVVYSNIISYDSVSRNYTHSFNPLNEGFTETGEYIIYAWQDFRNYSEVAFTYSALTILVEAGPVIPDIGNVIIMHVSGAQGATDFKIIAPDDKVIGTYHGEPNSQGEMSVPWLLPKDLPFGIYTIEVNDSIGAANTLYDYQNTTS